MQVLILVGGGPNYKQPILGGLQLQLGDLQNLINYVHAKGGKVKMSFGGANGAYYLTEALAGPWGSGSISIADMANFLVASVNYYGFDGIDLDLEDPSNSSYNEQFATGRCINS